MQSVKEHITPFKLIYLGEMIYQKMHRVDGLLDFFATTNYTWRHFTDGNSIVEPSMDRDVL